eukprot:TRINITY_DN32289_c0_g1_i1.p1 TRINITY_DN32289_c0_g1~~TRINITY_DN32289_c0_g1_i1.p1  ORF type:complete len:219 (-),score=17.36 TRINITY_DN32289_c0_g1_i1:274-930(-)
MAQFEPVDDEAKLLLVVGEEHTPHPIVYSLPTRGVDSERATLPPYPTIDDLPDGWKSIADGTSLVPRMGMLKNHKLGRVWVVLPVVSPGRPPCSLPFMLDPFGCTYTLVESTTQALLRGLGWPTADGAIHDWCTVAKVFGQKLVIGDSASRYPHLVQQGIEPMLLGMDFLRFAEHEGCVESGTFSLTLPCPNGPPAKLSLHKGIVRLQSWETPEELVT